MNAEVVIYQFDDVRVEPHAFKVFKLGRVVSLEPKAFEVLVFLIENRGRLVEKAELLDAVWKGTFVTDNALTRTIAQLRRLLGDGAREAKYIETVPTRGYRFIAQVEVKPRHQDSELTGDGPAVIPAMFPRMFRLLALVGGITFVSAVAFMAWRFQKSSESGPRTAQLRSTQITTSLGLDIFPTFSPDGGSIAYSSDRSGSFEIYVRSLAPSSREIQLTSDGKENFQPAWSPDGKLIAYYSRKGGGIFLVPALGGMARQLTELGSRPAWSPDSSWIAFQSDPLTDLGQTAFAAMPPSTIWIVSAQGGSPIRVSETGKPPGGHGSPSWSPDGKRIVFVASDVGLSDIWSVSTRGRELRAIVANQTFRGLHNLHDPIYSPDGESIYFSGGSRASWALWKSHVLPSSGEVVGEPVEIKNTGSTLFKHLRMSADGNRIVYSALSMTSNIWAVPVARDSGDAAGAPTPLTQDTGFRKTWPLFSPDGSRIAFSVARTGDSVNIWLMDANGQNATQVTADTTGIGLLGWFPKGDQIAFSAIRGGHRTLQSILIDTRKETLLRDLPAGTDGAIARMSPDAKQVAFNRRKEGTVNIWTAFIDGNEAKQLTFDKEYMGFPCWSPDGKLLAFDMKRGDDTHIGIIASDGGAPTQLTFDHGQSWPSSWSPDGDKIVFAGSRDGYWNIWWVSLGDKTQKKVTNYSKLNAFARYPSWSPLRNKIVYEYVETTGNIWLMDLK